MCFEREEGFFLGAFVVNFGVMLISLAAFIAVGVAVTLPDPDPVALAVGGAIVGVVVPIAFYPMSRTFWSAIDLIMKPLEPQEVESAAGATAGAERARA
jgi:xanthosine utilization system XapX-like protein